MGAQDQFACSDTLTMISRNIDPFPWDVSEKTTDWFSHMLLELFDILQIREHKIGNPKLIRKKMCLSQ